jgi:hypothetical protein
MDTPLLQGAKLAATALYAGMAVAELNDLDLSYTQPVSGPWDPMQMSAQALGQTTATTASSSLTNEVRFLTSAGVTAAVETCLNR